MRLEPTDPQSHVDALYDASHNASDPNLWTYLFVGPFPDKTEFKAYVESVAASPTDIFYTIVDEEAGQPAGIASYLRIVPEHGVIEIGHIWFGVGLQRTAGATEAIYLLARHVFEDLGYRRLEWKCDALNQRSRRAAERFGFTFEGIFQQHMVIKGKNRDTAWFAMLDRDWTLVSKMYESWLSSENFDANGNQIRSLGAIRQTLTKMSGGF